MTNTVKPRDAKEVEEALRWALDGDKPLEIVGGGSKRAIGRPSPVKKKMFFVDVKGLYRSNPWRVGFSSGLSFNWNPAEGLFNSRM